MAKQTVAELYTKLGLDISSLEGDFALADKTVDKALARLNHENKAIKIKADTDLINLEGAKDRMAAFRVQEAALSKQLEISRQRVDLLAASYKNLVAEKGRDNAASARMETRLLQEKKTYASLEAQIRKTKKAKEENTVANRMVNSVINGASAMSLLAQGAGDIGALSLLTSPLGKAVGVAAAVGTGVVAAAKSAMNAGNAIYELSQKLHTTNGEAAKMAVTFKLAGADVNSAVPAIVRLDKTLQSAGESGQRMSVILSAYGVSLKDQEGHLLPVNEQLEQLAIGYKNAAAAGMESEFVAETLGSRGAELVPVLSQMAEIQERMAHMPTTGLLDPDKAHSMMMDWRELQFEMNQISSSLGRALMPVVAEILPRVTEGVEDVTRAIEDNKDTIKDAADILSNTGQILGDILGIGKELLDPAGTELSNMKDILKGVNQALKETRDLVKEIKENSPGLQAIINYAPTPFNLVRFAGWGIRKLTGAPEEEKQEQKAPLAPKQKVTTTQDAETTRRLVEEATRQKEAAASAEKSAEREAELANDLYRATHNDLQNQIHDIDLRAEKLRKEGASEVEIAELTEAQKAKVYRNFNRDVISQIDASWRSELDNRLADIEREKDAWIEKGVSEVKATEWAEHEKGKVRQNAALSALKEQREYLEIVKNAMNGPGSMEERMNQARSGVLMAMRKKLGITNDFMTPELLSIFSTVMNDVKNNLVRGLETQDWARKLDQTGIPVIRGSEQSRDIPGITNTVVINGGVFENNETLQKYADRTAGKFVEIYRSAAQSANLGYGNG